MTFSKNPKKQKINFENFGRENRFFSNKISRVFSFSDFFVVIWKNIFSQFFLFDLKKIFFFGVEKKVEYNFDVKKCDLSIAAIFRGIRALLLSERASTISDHRISGKTRRSHLKKKLLYYEDGDLRIGLRGVPRIWTCAVFWWASGSL